MSVFGSLFTPDFDFCFFADTQHVELH
ncbi:hypothetical protein D046_2238A, partial [Vibrio parahaemolyticus V-223/04]